MFTMSHRLARACCALVTGALAFALPTSPAAAQVYPDRPVKLVVPFPPGGGADSTARMIGKRLADVLGQPVVVENRPGANGVVGTDAVAKAAPDGYTILMTDRGALGINPSLYSKLPYDPKKDFAYVGIAVWSPYVLVANPKAPVKDFAELVAYAKKQPCKLNYASFGVGSMAQMGMESLNAAFGMCTTHVPYKGGGPALQATMAHETDVTIATIGPALGAIREGRLKALAVGAAQRSPLLPDTPSIVEAGGTPDVIPKTYFGYAVPAGTPPAIVAKLSSAIRDIVNSGEVKDWLVAGGFEPADDSSEGMQRTVNGDIAQFAALATKVGIKPE